MLVPRLTAVPLILGNGINSCTTFFRILESAIAFFALLNISGIFLECILAEAIEADFKGNRIFLRIQRYHTAHRDFQKINAAVTPRNVAQHIRCAFFLKKIT